MAGRLAGKVAIVFGAGQMEGETIGNGRAISLVFGREGAIVECVDLVGSSAEETARLIKSEGGKAFSSAADISQQADVERVMAEVKSRHGRIDILVNNVGILAKTDATIDVVDMDTFDRTIAINVRGLVLSTKAVLPIMREQGGGIIVNMSSAASEWGGTQSAYEISKAAVNRITTTTAQSQAKYGIRCNAVKLGPVDTPLAIKTIAAASGRTEADVRASRDAMVPLGKKQGTAWDAAGTVLYLASEDSRYVTGTVIPVDGGVGIRAHL